MELLKRQLFSQRYIQHSARVLFAVGAANAQERAQILEAVFDLSPDELAKRSASGSISKTALAARDYVFDIFPGGNGKQ